MLEYHRTARDKRGLHIRFHEPVSADNFKEACDDAIFLARIECGAERVVAVNFEAQGIGVQVVECDSADVQLVLWKLRLGLLC